MAETASSAAAAATTVQTLLAFGFAEEQARAAVDAVGDKADAQLAITWLLDHGEEDKGGAVVFRHCPHLDGLRVPESLVSTQELSLGDPCAICASASENWICLFCGLHLCSRYVAQHSLSHWQETRKVTGPSTPHGHHLMLSESDLSVWCHACEAYIDNDEVQPHVEKLRAAKFGGGGAASSSSAGATSSGEKTTSAGAGESERACGKRKASAGMVAIPEDPDKTREPTPQDGKAKVPPSCGGSSCPPSPPAHTSLPCSADASPDVEWLVHQWEQSMVLADRVETRTASEDPISGISDETAQEAAAAPGGGRQPASAPENEPSAADRGASIPVPTRDLEVKSQTELSQRIFKGPDGTLSLVLAKDAASTAHDAEFVFAQRSREGKARRVAEWLHAAAIDLRYNLPLDSLPPHACAAAEAQAAVLDDCLALRTAPFFIRLRDPSRQSYIDLSRPRGTPMPAKQPPTPGRREAAGPMPFATDGAAGPARAHGLAEVADKLRHARNVVVMLGAGASVSAGIPDFRTPGTGLYSQLQEYGLPFPEAIFDLHFFLGNPAPFYRLARAMWPGQHAPTPAHYFVRLLADRGILRRCYSQNIDSLERTAGVPAERIVAAHGNFDGAHAWVERAPGQVERGAKVPIDELKQAVIDGAEALLQLNTKYGGLVKPDITFFAEPLPSRFAELIPDDFECCDLLLVMGTSLQVMPFASLVNFAPSSAPRLLINREAVGPFAACGGGDAPDGYFFFEADCDAGVTKLAQLAGMESELSLLIAEAMGGLGP